MSVKIIPDDFDHNLFNSKASHPLQSWEWGEARKQMGIEVVRVGEFRNDELVNIFQLTFHQIPKTKYKVGYLPRSVIPSSEVLNFIAEYGKKKNAVFIKIEPNIINSKLKLQATDYKIEESPHPLFPSWTQILDLTKSEDELFKNLKSKTRYNVRLALKKGVDIKEESDEKGFKIFLKLYFDTCKRQKYFGHNQEYHKKIWNNLKDKIAHILIAYFNNTPIAAYELFNFNGVYYYPYGGSSDQYRNTMAANLLMWEAIKLGKKLGAKSFDLWGTLPPDYDPTDPWAGFTRFKEGYNAQFVEMIGSYDLVINKNLYWIYNFSFKLRQLYLNLKK